ncbi:hypothetical protein JCGZ_08455 [Jatropha curcas]|uniref:DUF3741 domain-containing protein n=1 Tax=Jatropha curcas TaxID=180498 RepID=A0A067LGK5_JATCU|nr:hypothetical protein JCGZ_08455 [Jatropha curcas]
MKKLLPSPSISSSSSSASTTTNAKSATASCLTGILRRLLCSHSLPTHPSDLMTNTISIPSHIKQHHFINPASATPGIVASLMGLEPFPDNSTFQATANSLSRNRSTNPVEFRNEINDQMQGHRNRVNNSILSFREMPTFLELENEKFFVISFEGKGDKKENRSKQRKHDMGFGEFRKTRREKSKSKEHDASDLQELKKSNMLRDGAKLTRKKKKRNRCAFKNDEQEECSSEDLSPVCVLDFDQLDNEVQSPEEDAISRRKLSSRLADYVQLSMQIDNNIIKDDPNSKKTEEMCCENYVWGEVCGMAKNEVMDSNWKSKDVEEISADFELQILDLLLEEIVDQFSCQEKFEPVR